MDIDRFIDFPLGLWKSSFVKIVLYIMSIIWGEGGGGQERSSA